MQTNISLYQLLNSLLNYYGPRNKAKQKFLKRQGQRIQATSPLTLESRKSGTIRGHYPSRKLFGKRRTLNVLDEVCDP